MSGQPSAAPQPAKQGSTATHPRSGVRRSVTRVASKHPGPRWPVYAAGTVSWLGLLVHNVADLPDQTLLSPETLCPSLVLALLLVGYAAGLTRPAGIGLSIWAGLNLVGGALSVLPLPILPFYPEQTLRHYSFHLIYAATQIPLLAVSIRLARRRRPDEPPRGL